MTEADRPDPDTLAGALSALEASEERFRALVTAGANSIYRMSADWRMMYQLDSETLATTTAPIEDWVEKYIYGEDLPLVRQAIDSAIANRALFELEHRVKGKEGEPVWVMSRAVPLLDENGEIREWFGAGNDVTARRQAENALRESEERYRMLFDKMDQAFAVVEVLRDDDGRWTDFLFLEVNAAFVEHTTMSDAVGRRATAILGTPNPRWAQLYGQVIDTGVPLRVVEAEPTLGKIFDLNIFALDRDRSRVAVLFSDVTERIEQEDELRESGERFRLIVENARDYAIFIMDPDGVVTDWREGAETVFGYTPEEIVGRSGDVLYTPADNAAGEAEKERKLAALSGMSPNVRWHVCKNGRQVFIEGVNTALRDSRGRLTGFLKIGRDATERHESQRRQQLLLAELQHRVRNILAMIRSIVRQSRQGYDEIDEFVAHLVGRLDAMSRTQVMLTRAAGARIPLETIIRDELGAQAIEENRMAISGPEVELSPKAAEVVTMAIHELATNSIKYGALSTQDARLSVGWSVEAREGNEDWVHLRWRETGDFGTDGPVRRGFGTELIEARIPYELSGRADLKVRRNAVEATIAFPLRNGSSVLETTGVGIGVQP